MCSSHGSVTHEAQSKEKGQSFEQHRHSFEQGQALLLLLLDGIFQEPRKSSTFKEDKSKVVFFVIVWIYVKKKKKKIKII